MLYLVRITLFCRNKLTLFISLQLQLRWFCKITKEMPNSCEKANRCPVSEQYLLIVWIQNYFTYSKSSQLVTIQRKTNPLNTVDSCCFKTHFIFIPAFIPRFSKLPHSLRCSHHKYISIYSLPNVCYVTRHLFQQSVLLDEELKTRTFQLCTFFCLILFPFP